MNTFIEKLIQWIQHSYWDFLNKLYTQKCFNKESYKDLVVIGNTNIRNLYFWRL